MGVAMVENKNLYITLLERERELVQRTEELEKLRREHREVDAEFDGRPHESMHQAEDRFVYDMTEFGALPPNRKLVPGRPVRDKQALADLRRRLASEIELTRGAVVALAADVETLRPLAGVERERALEDMRKERAKQQRKDAKELVKEMRLAYERLEPLRARVQDAHEAEVETCRELDRLLGRDKGGVLGSHEAVPGTPHMTTEIRDVAVGRVIKGLPPRIEILEEMFK